MNRSGAALLAIAVVGGVAWRVELELRSGWEGLKWLDYFHWAVPVFVLAFIAWTVSVTRQYVRSPYVFAAVLLGFAAVASRIVDRGLRAYFESGAADMGMTIFLGGGEPEPGFEREMMLLRAAPLLWSFVPMVFLAICRSFGVWVRIVPALISAILFVASWPLAVFVRRFVEEHGGADLIHAAKSGFVIPFLVLSLGLPLLFLRPRNSRGENGAIAL